MLKKDEVKGTLTIACGKLRNGKCWEMVDDNTGEPLFDTACAGRCCLTCTDTIYEGCSDNCECLKLVLELTPFLEIREWYPSYDERLGDDNIFASKEA